MTDAERRQHRREAWRNWYARQKGQHIPMKQRGRQRAWQNTTPRCPVCGCEISATRDCKCP